MGVGTVEGVTQGITGGKKKEKKKERKGRTKLREGKTYEEHAMTNNQAKQLGSSKRGGEGTGEERGVLLSRAGVDKTGVP